MLLTPEQLKRVCEPMTEKRCVEVADVINRVCPMYGINSSDILHEFLANVAHESAYFSRYEENLNYSAKRLTQVWPSRFKTIADAKPFERNPKKLAMKVYGLRAELGNKTELDGWTFRGSGAIQTTGRKNIEITTAYINKLLGLNKTAEEMALLMRTSDEFAIHSACFFFAIAKGLVDEAISDLMEIIVKRINGALIGIKERMELYNKCVKFIP